MQVILREDMDNLGKSGEVVTVKPGYGRNYLIPQGLAVPATAQDVARVAHEKRVIASRNAKLMKDTQAVADRLNQVSVSIPVQVGEEDKLYGSVTARDIGEALREKGVTVDVKSLVLDEPLKTLGLAEVPVKLGRGVTATIKVWVVKKDA
jgi:large subunit ribosomal protein L9